MGRLRRAAAAALAAVMLAVFSVPGQGIAKTETDALPADGGVYVPPEEVAPGEEESVLLFCDGSGTAYDYMIGQKGRTVEENADGESSLPILPSYADGNGEFFYGWYLDRDADGNGQGVRFTAKTRLFLDFYRLYAKWGSGFFPYEIEAGGELFCQALSFDDSGRMAVSVSGQEAAAGSTPDDGTRDDGSKDSGLAALRLGGDGLLVIPASLSPARIPLRESLGVEIGSCDVMEIADRAFAGETGLRTAVLPDTLKRIGAGAFAGCASLETVNIPRDVTEIGADAFAGCASLRMASIPSGVTRLQAGTFAGCGAMTAVLPDTLKEIDPTAFDAASGLTVVCSSELARTKMVRELAEDGAAVQAVDLSWDAGEGEKEFYYGEPETITASVRVNGREEEGRLLSWRYEGTDAYAYEVDGGSITVTPKRVTDGDEEYSLTVRDVGTAMEKTVLIHTRRADLGRKDGNQEPLYKMELAEGAGCAYSGQAVCPAVMVRRNVPGGAVLSSDDYDVAYANNVNAGTARVTVRGKGGYAGAISRDFTIGKAGQEVLAENFTKSTKNWIFPIGAKSTGDGKLSYMSSNPEVAEVDGYGIATIRGIGVTNVSIRAGETQNYLQSPVKTITLTVDKEQDGFKIVLSEEKSMLKVAKTYYRVSLGKRSVRIQASSNAVIRYASSNEKVAAVSVSGHIIPKKCGKATITVRTKDDKKRVTVIVEPKKVGTALSSGKAGTMKVSWEKQKGASGYVVEYALSRDFKKIAGRKRVSAKKGKATIQGLVPGKKYYVRAKAYVSVGGKKMFGDYGKVRSKKVRK